ncbi:MAG TPA: hypothetical protein PK095_18625 [Myxococcota bacterium]|nr:hypothetical protein [Myxococcota bacterium]
MSRRAYLTASLLLAFATAGACDSQPAVPPGTVLDSSDATTADTSPDPDTTNADSTAPDSAEDTSVAPDTTADTSVDPDTTADTSVNPDTTADTSVTPDTTTDTDTSDTLVLPDVRPPVVTTSTTGLGGWTMSSGQEATKCVVKRLDNPDVLWVSQVRTQLSSGSHHLIVYKSDETVERPTPFDCDPFVETLKGQTFPLMITQIRQETLSFPNGVAFRFEPNQMIRLEAHYLNYFPNDITAEAQVHFDGIAESDVVSEANLLFYGNPDISIPANQTFTTPKRHLSVLPGTRVFAITGHTHAYGTDVSISVANNLNDPGQSIYPPEGEPYLWDEPPVSYFDPPLFFENGGGFNYTCSWNNTSNRRLGFGESANQEMCFFWAYYYPSQGYRLCVSPGTIGDGLAGDEVCCPGHWVCDYIQQFLD